MNAVETFVQGLVGRAVTAASATVAADPKVQAQLDELKAKAAQAETLLWVAGFMGVTTWIFFVVPRMEAPVPRVLRRRREGSRG